MTRYLLAYTATTIIVAVLLCLIGFPTWDMVVPVAWGTIVGGIIAGRDGYKYGRAAMADVVRPDVEAALTAAQRLAHTPTLKEPSP